MSPFYFIFFLLYMISFLLVINIDDWFILWLGMELNMMSFIMLVYKRFSIKHIESCFKYFFVQSLGSAIFMGVFYSSSDFLFFISMFILSYKMGGGPFYFWFPSVICGLDWLGCFILMSFQSIIPLMLTLIFINYMIVFVIFFSLMIGSLGSFNQKNLKRLLSFSSIHHIGWMLLCLYVDSIYWFVYLVLYSVVIYGLIYMFWKYEINGMSNVMKWGSKWVFVFGVLSLGGMPPLLGFFLKWLSFYYILSLNYSVIMFMIMFSVLMFYVYIRFIYDYFMGGVYVGSYVFIKFMSKYFFNSDIYSILGIFIGGFLGILLVM